MSSYNDKTTADEIATDCQSQIAGKTILVTGASPNGLGAIFATTIAPYGPSCIILATRSLAKAQKTAESIAAVAPAVRTHAVELNLASLSQVKTAAKEIDSLGEDIDILVNNAGIMAPPFSKSVDGIESQFATNHIGHFLLTNLLLPKILARGQPIRIVNVTSNGFRFGPPRFEDWNFDEGKSYNRWVAYGQSKSANMLFSVALAQKFGKKGVVSVSLHPGIIATTGLGRDLQMEDFGEFVQLDRTLGYKSFWDKPHQFKTPSEGVATHVFGAFHPSLDAAELNGCHLTDSQVMEPKIIQSWARDKIDAETLWAVSEKLVRQTFSF